MDDHRIKVANKLCRVNLRQVKHTCAQFTPGGGYRCIIRHNACAVQTRRRAQEVDRAQGKVGAGGSEGRGPDRQSAV